MTFQAVLTVAAVFLGCSGNAVFLELLTRADPGSGVLITSAQFLFISVIGFVFTSKLGTVERVVPIREYIILVLLFYFSNLTNNYALKFNISMPLHMIFRSGSLITNMLLGVIILKRSYSVIKYISVLMITTGISVCTIISVENETPNARPNTIDDSDVEDHHMYIGVGLLSIGLLLSSWLGIRQETLFTKFGKHPEEAVFYSHLLPLPGFLFFYKDIVHHAKLMAETDLIAIPYFYVAAPELLLYLLGNVFTQYLCISSVYTLQTECTSLTVTLVVTLRKFFSLLFSIFYFNNPFTFYHWIGTTLVFVGTLIFTDVVKVIKLKRELISIICATIKIQ